MGDQSADPDRLSDAAGRVNRGEVRIADLAGGLQRLPHPPTLATLLPSWPG
jgi:hypothetical protein